MLQKMLNEMIENGTVLNRYNPDSKNGKYYTYYDKYYESCKSVW